MVRPICPSFTDLFVLSESPTNVEMEECFIRSPLIYRAPTPARGFPKSFPSCRLSIQSHTSRAKEEGNRIYSLKCEVSGL
jgi:hypothetical protein